MTEGKKRILAILVVIAGLAVFFMLVSVLTDDGEVSSVKTVPVLSFKDLEDNSVNLEDYRGQVVMVNNFATWCPSCRVEMPDLEAYYKEHKGEGFVIVAIESGQSLEKVQSYVKEMGLSFPVLTDPEMKSVKAFRNNALPNSILIDREWKIRKAWVGEVDKAYLEKNVTPLLKE